VGLVGATGSGCGLLLSFSTVFDSAPAAKGRKGRGLDDGCIAVQILLADQRTLWVFFFPERTWRNGERTFRGPARHGMRRPNKQVRRAPQLQLPDGDRRSARPRPPECGAPASGSRFPSGIRDPPCGALRPPQDSQPASQSPRRAAIARVASGQGPRWRAAPPLVHARRAYSDRHGRHSRPGTWTPADGDGLPPGCSCCRRQVEPSRSPLPAGRGGRSTRGLRGSRCAPARCRRWPGATCRGALEPWLSCPRPAVRSARPALLTAPRWDWLQHRALSYPVIRASEILPIKDRVQHSGPFSSQKKFHTYSPPRIFGYMHEILNTVKKITNYTV